MTTPVREHLGTVMPELGLGEYVNRAEPVITSLEAFDQDRADNAIQRMVDQFGADREVARGICIDAGWLPRVSAVGNGGTRATPMSVEDRVAALEQIARQEGLTVDTSGSIEDRVGRLEQAARSAGLRLR